MRRKEGVTAFVEGWGLYSERLADEMGLYSSDVDRLGMLSFDAWRACRLVVDTGIHAQGWTRQRAIDYMIANTALAPNNIANEVDRYITWPGQALAYKLGQLEILALRDEARTKLGARFDLKQFRDVVLRNGAVALPVLRREGWEVVETSKWPYRPSKEAVSLTVTTETAAGEAFQGNDWFSLGFQAEIGGKRVDVAPLIAAFLHQMRGGRIEAPRSSVAGRMASRRPQGPAVGGDCCAQ